MFNYDKLADMLKARWKDSQKTTWGNSPYATNEITTEIKGDFIIGIGKIVGNEPIIDDKFMQRYFLYVYSIGQLCVIWSDSNVIDASCSFTPENVIERCKNNLTHELNKLNNL